MFCLRRIPDGTSKELTDLLLKLLTRNSKSRIGFEEFFDHSFMMNPKKEISRPVAVPKSIPSSPISCSPSIQSPASYGSPVVHEVRTSPYYERHQSGRLTDLKNSPRSDDSSPDHEVEEGFVVINPNAKIRAPNPGKVASSKSNSSSLRPDPVPVPGRKDAFERIQKSINKSVVEVEEKKENKLRPF